LTKISQKIDNFYCTYCGGMNSNKCQRGIPSYCGSAHAVQLGPAFLLMSRLDRVTGFVSLLFAHGQRNAIPPERYHSVRVPHSPDSRITVVDAQIDPPACAQKA